MPANSFRGSAQAFGLGQTTEGSILCSTLDSRILEPYSTLFQVEAHSFTYNPEHEYNKEIVLYILEENRGEERKRGKNWKLATTRPKRKME